MAIPQLSKTGICHGSVLTGPPPPPPIFLGLPGKSNVELAATSCFLFLCQPSVFPKASSLEPNHRVAEMEAASCPWRGASGTLFIPSLPARCVYAGANAHLCKIRYLSLSIIFLNVIFEEPFFFSWLQSVTKNSQMHCKLARGWELGLLER